MSAENPSPREIAVADWLIKRNVALPGLSYQEAAESIVAAIDRADWRMAFDGPTRPADPAA